MFAPKENEPFTTPSGPAAVRSRLTGLVAAVLGLLISQISPAAAQAPATAAGWYASYQRDSRLVRLPGGRQLSLYCIGKGSPTVILESGIGESALTWWPVQERIAKLTRVCAYDRAGIGNSPMGPLPRDTRSEVADLEALLRAAHVRPPYLLVGHSMGGYNVRLFAFRHPRDVAGLVLIDPSVENQIPVLEAAVPAIARTDKQAVSYVTRCADPNRTAEVAKSCVRPAPAGFPPDLAARFVANQGLDSSRTFQSEVLSFLNTDSQQLIAERRSLGAMPLIVLTRGELSTNMTAEEAATEWRIWNGMHEEVATLSTDGSNRVVKGANHYIHQDKPDVVVDAIAEVLAKARSARRGGRRI